jgi:hypothetical protein
MLEFNGRRFAENEREVTDSLFDPRGTVSGMAKRHARRIDLFELNGSLVGAITRNGIVATAKRRDDGKTWYSYGWPAIAGEELSLSATRDAIEAIAVRRSFDFARGESVYWYKGKA